MRARSAIILCVICFTVVVAGCSNPGIVKLSPDTYMLARTDKGVLFGNPSQMKTNVIREANEFAASQGKVAAPISLKEEPMHIGHFASIEYQFRVVDGRALLEEQIKLATTECRQKRLNRNLKSYVESVRCSNPVILEAHQEAGDPNMDLIQLLCAYRMAVAELEDKGKLTEAEGNVAIEELVLRVSQEGLLRAMQQQAESRQQQAMDLQQQNNARMQAYGTLLQGLGTWQPANKIETSWISTPKTAMPNLVPAVQPMISITCQRVGDFTYCD